MEDEQEQIEYDVTEAENKMIGVGVSTPMGFMPFFALANWEEFLRFFEAMDKFKKSRMSIFVPVPEVFLKAFGEERGSDENVSNTEK